MSAVPQTVAVRPPSGAERFVVFLLGLPFYVLLPLAVPGAAVLTPFAFLMHIREGYNFRKAYQISFGCLMAIVLLVGGIALTIWLTRTKLITDPLLHPVLFAGYLGVLFVWLTRSGGVGEGRRETRDERVRAAVTRHLACSADEARQRLLAVVPCRARDLGGFLDKLRDRKDLWLCFLSDRLLVVSGRTGELVELGVGELRRVCLEDSSSPTEYRMAIEDASGGRSLLRLHRLTDQVRVVNVLNRLGIVLTFLPSPREFDLRKHWRLWQFVRRVAIFEVAGAIALWGFLSAVNTGENTNPDQQTKVVMSMRLGEDGRLYQEDRGLLHEFTEQDAIRLRDSRPPETLHEIRVRIRVVQDRDNPDLNRHTDHLQRWFAGMYLEWDEIWKERRLLHVGEGGRLYVGAAPQGFVQEFTERQAQGLRESRKQADDLRFVTIVIHITPGDGGMFGDQERRKFEQWFQGMKLEFKYTEK